MLIFSYIVVAILKMATGRNCSMSGINSGHHYLSTYQIVMTSDNVEAKNQHCPTSSQFDMWVHYDVSNWFLTLNNFYRSRFILNCDDIGQCWIFAIFWWAFWKWYYYLLSGLCLYPKTLQSLVEPKVQKISDRRIQDIEVIDITGSGENTLKLNLDDLLYCANAFVQYCKSKSITQSMSRRGNCWDNAVMERFFRSNQT
jgi:hypothetical protein